MNILIPHQWLLEHLETTASPEEIQKYLSLSGPSVERIYDREGDQVYDIEVTTNRVDSFCVRGIAREAVVILNRQGIKSRLKPLQLSKLIAPTPEDSLPFPKVTNLPEVCYRTLGVVIKNVQHTPTPEWMAKRLRQVELNVHDSVIDITNYVTHDLGHPCHAFDYDQIMALGGEIIIQIASAGQPFTTLDGIEHQTIGGEIVFVNPQGKIIDFPAIKGTANTSINDQTQNVLLWLESLSATKVRQASMAHAIRTTAAQLNEKGVDPHLGELVLKKGLELYQQLTHGQMASPIYDDFPGAKQLAPVKISLAKIETYLGVKLPVIEITQILTDLECQVEVNSSPAARADGNTAAETTILTVTPPTYRPDLTIPADIVEEIARIYGYHNLPSELMAGALPTNRPTDADYDWENQAQHFLAALGWQELYTYSLVSDELAKQSGWTVAEHLAVTNPLTTDHTYLRRSLLPSLLEAINANPTVKDISVFELAHLYQPVEGELPIQKLSLTGLSTQSYRQVRGDVENLLNQFYLPRITIQPIATHQPLCQQAGQIIIGDDQSVVLGQIYVLKNGLIGFELDYEQILTQRRKYPTYQPLAKTNPVIEDLTFALPAGTTIGQILATVTELNPLITQVELKDIFKNHYTLTIYYQHPEKNLASSDVQPVRHQIVTTLAQKYQAQLVGELK